MFGEMLGLLRINSVANPEKLLLELVDQLLSHLDQVIRDQSKQNDSIKINKVSNCLSFFTVIGIDIFSLPGRK